MLGIYVVPEAETLKISITLNNVLHIYLVSYSSFVFIMDGNIKLKFGKYKYNTEKLKH